MSDSRYSFEQRDDDVFVSYTAPCGDVWKDVAVIREISSQNPCLQLCETPGSGRFVGSIGFRGLIEIVSVVVEHSKKQLQEGGRYLSEWNNGTLEQKPLKHAAIFTYGFDHGYEAATFCEYDADDGREEFEEFVAEAFLAQENARSFTPFEALAKELNGREDSEDVWDTFEEGVASGIVAGAKDRLGGLRRADKTWN